MVISLIFTPFSVLGKAKTLRNQLDYSKVSLFLHTESAFSVYYTSQCHTKAVLIPLCCLCATFHQDNSIFHCFILLFSLVYLSPLHLTEPPKKNRTSFHCNLYHSWEMSFSKSMCEGRRGPIGVQEETEATEEGSDGVGGVIWSRLKPEQEGLVTKAYLWRRHWGSETVALWENLLQQTCRKGDMGRSLKGRRDEGTRGGKLRAGQSEGWNLGEEKERPWAHECKTLLWFGIKMGPHN